jgi:restriction system protein
VRVAIPDYQTLMLPLLAVLGDRQPRHVRDLTAALGEEFRLTDDELSQLTPGGGSLLFHGRVGWAKTYLSQAGLLEQVARGVYRVSPAGLQVLQECPNRIDNDFLMRFEGFQDFRNRSGTRGGGTNKPGRGTESTERDGSAHREDPTERLNTAYQEIRAALATDLLNHVKQASPQFFEVLVIDLLVAMGYGGSRDDAGLAVGKSGDGGIDGIIKEDRLGLDVVYIQAKRWENPVGRPIVQAFAGSLDGERARKGVLISTSRFTPDAEDYVRRIEKRIVLIDGEQLASYMIDFGIGVTDVTTLQIRRIDQDYFEG